MATGNMVIGSGTAMAYALNVTGNILLGGNIIPSANVTYDLGSSTMNWRDIYSEDFILVSDRRKKTNIENLDYGLQTILKLNPVKYNWIGREHEEKRIGLIAQDLQAIVHEAVNVGADEQHSMAIRYIDLIPVLIKAVQEQQREIKSQDDRIKRLEALLNTGREGCEP